jgi:hypothetical protein
MPLPAKENTDIRANSSYWDEEVAGRKEARYCDLDNQRDDRLRDIRRKVAVKE